MSYQTHFIYIFIFIFKGVVCLHREKLSKEFILCLPINKSALVSIPVLFKIEVYNLLLTILDNSVVNGNNIIILNFANLNSKYLVANSILTSTIKYIQNLQYNYIRYVIPFPRIFNMPLVVKHFHTRTKCWG